jgi:STE24 endopeptidase
MFCWLGVVLVAILLQYLAPIIILPLFNTFTPLPEGKLRDIIFDYAQRQEFVIRDIFTMDGSKRSGKLNAFFIGFGKFKKIVFFDTLVEKLDETEALAVLAHEMGHYKLKHIPKMIFASIIQTGVMFYLLSIFLNTSDITSALGIEQPSVYASLVVFGFLYSPINLLVSILFHAISRKHEFEADRYASITTGSSEALITSLKKLSKANFANLTPHPLKVFIHYSHPPLLARIERLRQHRSFS